MKHDTDNLGNPGLDVLAPGRIDRAVLICALIAFLALLGAYVALKLGGQDPSDLLKVFAQLAGMGVIGAGVTSRLTPRIARLEQITATTAQDTKAVRRQTNGELDKRVRTMAYEATRKALSDHLAAADNEET